MSQPRVGLRDLSNFITVPGLNHENSNEAEFITKFSTVQKKLHFVMLVTFKDFHGP